MNRTPCDFNPDGHQGGVWDRTHTWVQYWCSYSDCCW